MASRTTITIDAGRSGGNGCVMVTLEQASGWLFGPLASGDAELRASLACFARAILGIGTAA